MYSARAVTDEHGYINSIHRKVDQLAYSSGDILESHARKDYQFLRCQLGDLSHLAGWDLMALELINEGLSLYSPVAYAKNGRIRVIKQITENRTRLTCVKKGDLHHIRKELNTPFVSMG